MVRQPETVEVANFLIDKMGHGVVTAELLQPDELVSGIIAQVKFHHNLMLNSPMGICVIACAAYPARDG